MFLATRIFFILVLAVLAIIDFRRGVIPNKIVYPATMATFLINILSESQGVLPAVITGLLLSGILAAAGLLQRKMGMGDIKLAFLIGLMTGLPSGFIALTLGIFLGGITAIVFLVLRLKTRKDEMPYGPYLASGAIIVIMFSSWIETFIHGLVFQSF